MKKYILILIALVIVCLGLNFLANRSPKEVRTIKVGYLAIGAALPIFVAEKNGYFEEQGLNVELVEFKTSNDVATAGLAGQIDVVGAGATNVMLDANANAGGEFKIFLLNNYVKRPNGQSTDFILARSNSNISNVADFKGKTIAIFPGSIGEVFLKVVVPKLGLKVEDINLVSMAPAQWLPALESGSIDGVFGVVEPFATQILQNGSGKIVLDGYYSEVMPTVPISGGWFIDGRLSKKEELAFYDAVNKSKDFIVTNEKEARQILGDFTPTPKDQLTEVRLQDWMLIEEPGAEELVQDLVAIFYKNGGLKFPPTNDNWIWKK